MHGCTHPIRLTVQVTSPPGAANKLGDHQEEQDAFGFPRNVLGEIKLMVLLLDRDANDIRNEESYPLSSCNPPDLLGVWQDAMLRCKHLTKLCDHLDI